MASKILCDTVLSEGAGEWFGRVVVSNIRYEDGSPVPIKDFLGFKFKHPSNKYQSAIPNAFELGLGYTFSPWQETMAQVIAHKEIDQKTNVTTVKIIFSKGYTINKSVDQLACTLDGD